MSVLLTKCCWGDPDEEVWMSWTCSIKGKTNVCSDNGGKPKGKRHLEDTEIDGKIIKWIFQETG